MTLINALQKRLKKLKGAIEVVESNFRPPASASSLAKADAALGRPLAPALRALYEVSNGFQLETSRDEESARIDLVPIEEMFGSNEGRPWDDEAFRGILWQDDFEAENIVRFKRVRPLHWFHDNHAVVIDISDDSMHWVDRWQLEPLGCDVETYLAGYVDHLGLEDFVDAFQHPELAKKFELRRTAFMRPPKKVKQAKVLVGSRVVVSTKLAKYNAFPQESSERNPRGEVLEIDGKRVALELDAGHRAWFAKRWVTVIETKDEREELIADPDYWDTFLSRPDEELAAVLSEWDRVEGENPNVARARFNTTLGKHGLTYRSHQLHGLVRRLSERQGVGVLLTLAERIAPFDVVEKGQPRRKYGIRTLDLVTAIYLRGMYATLVGKSCPRERWSPEFVERYTKLVKQAEPNNQAVLLGVLEPDHLAPNDNKYFDAQWGVPNAARVFWGPRSIQDPVVQWEKQDTWPDWSKRF